MISDSAAETSTIPLVTGNTSPAATSPTPPAKRPTVLVVEYSDGWIELFGDQRQYARFAMLISGEGEDGDRFCKEWVALRLPRRHREIFLPSRLKVVRLSRCERPPKVGRHEILIERNREIGGMEAGR